MHVDITELDLPPGIRWQRSAEDPYSFHLLFSPDAGPFRDTHIPITIAFPLTYPFSPPRVRCLVRLFHPNIDLLGHVCLNILRLDWSPVLSLGCVLLGVWMMMQEPQGEEPLNQVAGEMLRRSMHEYARVVEITKRGGRFGGEQYDDITKVTEPFT